MAQTGGMCKAVCLVCGRVIHLLNGIFGSLPVVRLHDVINICVTYLALVAQLDPGLITARGVQVVQLPSAHQTRVL